jgi:hypothetical protein
VNDNNSRGQYVFTGSWTNQPYADFLLGTLNSDSISSGTTPSYLFNTSLGFFFQDDWKITSRLTLNLGLRYELPGLFHDKYGRWSNFVPELGKLVVASFAGAIPGTAFVNASQVETAQQAGLPSSLAYPNEKDFAPRFGFAWRPFGGNQMSLRGGYGIFYGTHQMTNMLTDLSYVFPFTISQSVNRNANNPNYLTLSSPFPVAPTLTSNVLNVAGYQLHAPASYLQDWNLTLERSIGLQSAVEIGYMGSFGLHWPTYNNINEPFRSAATYPNFPVPYPAWSTINYFGFEANSNYSAGSVTFRRRFAHGFFYRASHTYAKALDDGSQIQQATQLQAQDARNLRANRGRSDWDVGHSFTMAFSGVAPWRGFLLRGWQLAGSGIARTGQPFTLYVTNTNLTLGEASRPNRIAKGTVPHPSVNQWYDLSAFPQVLPSAYTFGNAGRNILDAPGSITVNVALSRNFGVWEKGNLQFRWETFNVLNRANFGLPVITVNAPNAGTITTAGAARSMQAALRYSF